MGEFLKITSTPAQIIADAVAIKASTEGLGADLAGLLAEVDRLGTPDVIGHDKFASGFTQSYLAPMPDGKTYVDSTVDGLKAVPEVGGQYTDAVTSAMEGYLVTDGQGAADIRSV